MFQDGSGGTTILFAADYKASRQQWPARILQPRSKLPRSDYGKTEVPKPAVRPGSSCQPRDTPSDEDVDTESLHCRAADETKLRGPGTLNTRLGVESTNLPTIPEKYRTPQARCSDNEAQPRASTTAIAAYPRRSRRPTRRAVRTAIRCTLSIHLPNSMRTPYPSRHTGTYRPAILRSLRSSFGCSTCLPLSGFTHS